MKIYAHRGASIDFPEMTMRAYKGALDDGADGFECDVRLSKDNQLVLWHDADMQRVAGNSARIADSRTTRDTNRKPLAAIQWEAAWSMQVLGRCRMGQSANDGANQQGRYVG